MNKELTSEEIKAVERGPIAYEAVIPTKTWYDSRVERIERLTYASKQRIPHLPQLEPHNGVAAIIGASPSVVNHTEHIKKIKANEFNIVMPLNGAHNWLLKNDIIPSIHVLFEVDLESPEQALGGPPHKDVYYYTCSHLHQNIFKALEDYHRVLWHCFDEPPEYQALVGRLFPGEFMVGGGHVTFFRSINIAIILGFRRFELFGCDGSFEGESSHYEGYHSYAGEGIMDVIAGGSGLPLRRFRTNPSLSFMTHEFLRFCEANQSALRIRVNGNGLMRHLHQQTYPEQYESVDNVASVSIDKE
jgi:Protein of unknown function DUF115